MTLGNLNYFYTKKYYYTFLNMVYIDKKFLNMCLAGLASVLAGGFTHPIDTVKIRL